MVTFLTLLAGGGGGNYAPSLAKVIAVHSQRGQEQVLYPLNYKTNIICGNFFGQKNPFPGSKTFTVGNPVGRPYL